MSLGAFPGAGRKGIIRKDLTFETISESIVLIKRRPKLVSNLNLLYFWTMLFRIFISGKFVRKLPLVSRKYLHLLMVKLEKGSDRVFVGLNGLGKKVGSLDSLARPTQIYLA